MLPSLLTLFILLGCAERPLLLPPITARPTQAVLAGKFVWFDLLTADLEQAGRFYQTVFGWTLRPERTYSVIRHDGKPIGTIVAAENRDDGMDGSRWLSSLSVYSVDAAVDAVVQGGGTVLKPAADEPNRGRTAVVADPQGAPFVLLRASNGDPPDRTPGAYEWLWTDLFTTDPDAAVDFYARVAGLEPVDLETEKGERFVVLLKDGKPRASVIRMPFKGRTPEWIPYVSVRDLDATIRLAEQSGGKLLLRGMDAAVIADPTGAAVGIQAHSGEEGGPP